MVCLAALQWLGMIGLVMGTSVEFPNPQKEYRLCGRRNASYVCDPEFVLDIGDVDRLDHLAQEFRKSTTCLCSKCDSGVSIGIFVRRSLTEESAKLYPNGKGVAEMVRKRWHLGNCNDDIVIILLTDMNVSDYSMGSSVQAIFPDKTAKLIMSDCRIHFLSACFYQGLESVVSSFNDVLVRLQKHKKSLNKSLIVGVSLGIGVLLIILLVAVILLRRQSSRRKEGCSQNIYESVPTKSNHENFLNDKINEYQLDKLHKQSIENENEENYARDESVHVNNLPRKFSQMKRQLSDLVEESDESETTRENVPFNASPYSTQGTNHSLQITEL